MSDPVNVAMPCDGDAYTCTYGEDFPYRDCEVCLRFCMNQPDEWDLTPDDSRVGSCLGSTGWPLMAHAAAEVARERREA